MKISNEIKVTSMIILVLAILGYLTVKTGTFNLHKDGYDVKIIFNDVDGVNLNSPVMYTGYEVGIVQNINIIEVKNDIQMELTVWIKKDARLRQGAKAYIKNLGFLGEKYVGITSGKPGEPFLAPGSTIIGQRPPNFDKLVEDGREIAKEIKEIMKNVNERLDNNKEHVDSIVANIDHSMVSASSVISNVDERLKNNEQNIDYIISNLRVLSVNLEELSADLKQNPWKILYRQKEKK